MSPVSKTGRLGTSLRIPVRLLERAQGLVDGLNALPQNLARPYDRATVLIEAIARGLHSLEREVGAARRDGSAGARR